MTPRNITIHSVKKTIAFIVEYVTQTSSNLDKEINNALKHHSYHSPAIFAALHILTHHLRINYNNIPHEVIPYEIISAFQLYPKYMSPKNNDPRKKQNSPNHISANMIEEFLQDDGALLKMLSILYKNFTHIHFIQVFASMCIAIKILDLSYYQFIFDKTHEIARRRNTILIALNQRYPELNRLTISLIAKRDYTVITVINRQLEDPNNKTLIQEHQTHMLKIQQILGPRTPQEVQKNTINPYIYAILKTEAQKQIKKL